MPLQNRITLTQYLIEQRRRFPSARGTLNALLLDVAMACKTISREVSRGELLASPPGMDKQPEVNGNGKKLRPMDVISNEVFLRFNEWSGNLRGIASEDLEQPHAIPAQYPRGDYLLVIDPMDGSANIDVNVPVGSIFSILRVQNREVALSEHDFLQAGAEQVAAGYAIYGPATMLVLSVGNGVVGFTLDKGLGEFMLTHPGIKVPENTNEFAINASNSRFWEPPIKRYVDECLAGKSGPRGKDFNMRWVASMVAEAHQIFMRGGVFMYPRDSKESTKNGRIKLLYEANPVGFLIEQAGGRASTGRGPVLAVEPDSLQQRIGLVFGSKNEVEYIEKCHQEPAEVTELTPLFAERGLFRN